MRESGVSSLIVEISNMIYEYITKLVSFYVDTNSISEWKYETL